VSSPNATRFELALYVEPEHVEKVRALIERGDDHALLLDIEKLVGIRLDNEPNYQVFGFSEVAGAEYGADVAECYCEGQS
jgi:hypothetical protein